jgi:hypothetical protein
MALYSSQCVSVVCTWMKKTMMKMFLPTILLLPALLSSRPCTTCCTLSFSFPPSITTNPKTIMTYNTKAVYKHIRCAVSTKRQSKLTLFYSNYDKSTCSSEDDDNTTFKASTCTRNNRNNDNQNLYSLGLKPTLTTTTTTTPLKSVSLLSSTTEIEQSKSIGNDIEEGGDKEGKGEGDKENSNHDNHERNWNFIDTKSLLQEQEQEQQKLNDKRFLKKKTLRSINSARTSASENASFEGSMNNNDSKQEMKSLLSITMPNPSDYHHHNKMNTTFSSLSKSKSQQHQQQQQQNNDHLQSIQSISKPNNNNLSSYASSFMDSFVNATTTSINTAPQLVNSLLVNMTKTPPQSSSSSSSSSLLMNHNIANPNALLTLSDLQRILHENGYVKRDELFNFTSSSSSNNQNNKSNNTSSSLTKTIPTPSTTSRTTTSTTATTTTTKKSKKIAFPQPSIISNKHIRIGTSISSSFFTILIAISLQPNLWLIGSVIGAIVGNDVATKNERRLELLQIDNNNDDDGSDSGGNKNSVPGGLYGDISLTLGTHIARIYLKIWDVVQGVWFMVS